MLCKELCCDITIRLVTINFQSSVTPCTLNDVVNYYAVLFVANLQDRYCLQQLLIIKKTVPVNSSGGLLSLLTTPIDDTALFTTFTRGKLFLMQQSSKENIWT
jgi:hypothetical protein